MRSGLLAPRPAPPRAAPLIAGSTVVLLALPIFLAAGWSVLGWVIAAVLWVVGSGFGLLLTRLPTGADNLAASGVQALGMVSRGVGVMIVLFAIAVSRPHLALAAAAVYAAAYTLELGVSLLFYFGGGGGT
jgi:hypothetical protein